jgi:hypothetical protein
VTVNLGRVACNPVPPTTLSANRFNAGLFGVAARSPYVSPAAQVALASALVTRFCGITSYAVLLIRTFLNFCYMRFSSDGLVLHTVDYLRPHFSATRSMAERRPVVQRIRYQYSMRFNLQGTASFTDDWAIHSCWLTHRHIAYSDCAVARRNENICYFSPLIRADP